MQMGTNMCTAADAAAAAATLNGEEVPVVTKVHHFAHRYAKAKGQGETAKDRLTWHCGCLLEWSDGRGITIVELAWWSGLGGYVSSAGVQSTAWIHSCCIRTVASWRPRGYSKHRGALLCARSYNCVICGSPPLCWCTISIKANWAY